MNTTPLRNMTAAPSASMEIPEDERPRTQVERVAAKFGSIRRMWRALRALGADLPAKHPGKRLANMDISTIYKWNLPTGGNGRVPSKKVPYVNQAARREGIVLTDEDWSPVRK
jgi:hypothetical protein